MNKRWPAAPRTGTCCRFTLVVGGLPMTTVLS